MNRIVLLGYLLLSCSIWSWSQDSIPVDSVSVDLEGNLSSDSLSIQQDKLISQHLYDQAILPTIQLINHSLEQEDGYSAHRYRFQLAKLYFYLGWLNEALEILEYCQVYYRQNQNNIEYVRVCHLLSLINQRLNNQEMANYFFGQTELEKPITNNPFCRYEHLMLSALLKPELSDSIRVQNLLQVIKFSKENSILDLHYQAYLILGDLYSSQQKTEEACIAYQKSLALSTEASYLAEMQFLNLKIHHCLTQQNLFKEANSALLNYININEKLSNIQKNEGLQKSVKKYENKTLREERIDLAQDKRIFELKSRRSNFTLIGLLISVGGILFMVFLIILFYQQKLSASDIILKQNEQINQQKIKELEQTIILQNLESMLKGQEEERERIAKDLHDSLGGLLSTIKLRYDKLIYEDNEGLRSSEHQKVHDLIDVACREIRNISHDLTPGALQELGLIDAIQDMLNRYDDYKTSIIFQHYGFAEDKDDLDEETSLYVYRIIQELVNNSYKHSHGNEILVQLSRQENQIEITVEDDGKGYDESKISKGMGLDNINSRVSYLKGEISVRSEINQGTSTYIVLPLIRSGLPA